MGHGHLKATDTFTCCHSNGHTEESKDDTDISRYAPTCVNGRVVATLFACLSVRRQCVTSAHQPEIRPLSRAGVPLSHLTDSKLNSTDNMTMHTASDTTDPRTRDGYDGSLQPAMHSRDRESDSLSSGQQQLTRRIGRSAFHEHDRQHPAAYGKLGEGKLGKGSREGGGEGGRREC